MNEAMSVDEAIGLACRHARLGHAAFPVAISMDGGKARLNKRPLTTHGHLDASTDPAVIGPMFKRAHLADGEAWGVGRVVELALDVDIRADVDGHDTLDALESAHGALPPHPVYLTPSGGSHHELSLPEGIRVSQGAASKLGEGIDVRTRDGWVVASGTTTPWGSWDREESTQGIEAPLAPGWLLELLGATNGAQAQSIGPWRPVDRTTLNPADLAALEALESLGGHNPFVGSDGTLRVTRPGKDQGVSATIGHIGPGVTKVFTSQWPPFGQGWVLDLDLLQLAAKGSDVRPLLTSNRRNQGPDTSDTRTFEIDDLRAVGGGAIFDEPKVTPAVWGEGAEVLWAEGEAFVLVAPPGVGKTTLAGQLISGLVGIRREVLGWPIARRDRVLYLAADRPRQIMRSLRRQFSEDQRSELNERLVIWRGPPPADLARHPSMLVELCAHFGADTIVLDSLKDMAIGLTDDTVGAGVNQAVQTAIAQGIEVGVLHHQRKGRDGVRPKTLEDVYGSTWITAGAGSVVLLWGVAGDLLVELIHLKQPADVVGPLKIEHDHTLGLSTVYRGFDPLRFLLIRGPAGATAADAARHWFEKARPAEGEVAKARRKLDGLVGRGLAVRTGASFGGEGGSAGATYRAVPPADPAPTEHRRSTDGAPTKTPLAPTEKRESPAQGHRRQHRPNAGAFATDGAPTAPTLMRENPAQSTIHLTNATDGGEHRRNPPPPKGEGSGAGCIVCGGSEVDHAGALHEFARGGRPDA